MNQINAQTPGPLFVGRGERIQTKAAPWNGRILADMTHNAHPETRTTKAEARLFAAAYTAFDKAGRELGLDAATLAESIDLAALIRAAQLVRNGWSTSDRTKASAGEAAILKVLAPVNALLP